MNDLRTKRGTFATDPRSPMERIAEKCIPEPMSGCLLYMGQVDLDGYGRIWVGPRATGSSAIVHRLVWEAAHGPIPSGLVLRHACDTRCCCELSHLSLGTPADNVSDAFARGRRIRKVTAQQIAEIRRLRREGGLSLAAIAERYGISIPYASQLASGRFPRDPRAP